MYFRIRNNQCWEKMTKGQCDWLFRSKYENHNGIQNHLHSYKTKKIHYQNPNQAVFSSFCNDSMIPANPYVWQILCFENCLNYLVQLFARQPSGLFPSKHKKAVLALIHSFNLENLWGKFFFSLISNIRTNIQ